VKEHFADLLLVAADIGQLAGEDEGFFLDYLPRGQADAIRRNRRGEDRRRRLLVRILLAFGLHLLTGNDARSTLASLAREEDGRPVLRDSPWQIGFSHAAKWAVCVIGDGGVTGCVGVDIEEIRPVPVDDFHLVFAAAERKAIAAAADPSAELIRRWTIKEAVLKVRGKGFLEDPRQVNTDSPLDGGADLGCHWQQVPVDEGYLLTVAARWRWQNLRMVRPLKEEWRPLFGA